MRIWSGKPQTYLVKKIEKNCNTISGFEMTNTDTEKKDLIVTD